MNHYVSHLRSILPMNAKSSARWSLFLFATGFAGIMSSCLENSGVEFSSFVDIPESGIPSGWEYEFSPVPTDSCNVDSIPYDVMIVVRYSASAKPREITFNLEEISFGMECPDSTKLTIPLFDKEDRPIGNGIYSIYETTDTLHRSIKIPEGYSISVGSNIPQEETEGIHAIVIVMSRSGAYKTLKNILDL